MKYSKGFLFLTGYEDPEWFEPFGRVLMETMACGSPPTATNKSSCPEIITPETGFLINSYEDIVDSINRLGNIDRRACREHVEQNFNRRRMTQDYIALFRGLIEKHKARYVESETKLEAELIT